MVALETNGKEKEKQKPRARSDAVVLETVFSCPKHQRNIGMYKTMTVNGCQSFRTKKARQQNQGNRKMKTKSLKKMALCSSSSCEGIRARILAQATASSAHGRFAALLASLFFFSGNQLFHQFWRRSDVLGSGFPHRKVLADRSGGEVIACFEDKGSDRAGTEKWIQARRRRSLACTIQEITILKFHLPRSRSGAVAMGLAGLARRGRLARHSVRGRTRLIDRGVEAGQSSEMEARHGLG